MRPAPLHTLLTLLPTVQTALKHVDELGPNPLLGELLRTIAYARRVMPSVDDSEQALAVKQGLSRWMREHHFSDAWIEDAAESTLLLHARGQSSGWPSKSYTGWHLNPGWEHLNPRRKTSPYLAGETSPLSSI